MKHTVFISDLHLQESAPEKTELFLKFLTGKALQADAVYILGDLFEAWVGDDDCSIFNAEIRAALQRFSKSGTPLYFMRGNRDFLIGQKFAAETGCKLIPDPDKINLYGLPTVLTHGDILCTKDIPHLSFRKYVHNPKYNRFFLILPLKLRKLIAKLLRAQSTKRKLLKHSSIKDVTLEAVTAMMLQHHAAQIIHGHTHFPATHDIMLNTTTGKRIVLGAWENGADILIYYENHTHCRKKYFAT